LAAVNIAASLISAFQHQFAQIHHAARKRLWFPPDCVPQGLPTLVILPQLVFTRDHGAGTLSKSAGSFD
jgi:hypothetical protein